MTTAQSKVRDHAINAAVTAIATLFLTFGTGLWSSKESVTTHQADVQRIEAEQRATNQAINAKLERVLDGLCEIKNVRSCGQSPAVP